LPQRGLANARGDDRRTLLERLDALEARERSLRDGLALQNPRFAALRRPTLQSASDVRNALGPDSALLSFQLSPVAQQPSSLFVITSQGLRTHRLPGRPVIDHKVAQFVGLIEAGHDERRAASQLYRELFGTALDELDPAVNRLVIVPDGALYRLPFDALRAAPEERPLAERFSITIAPSASVWLRLRRIPDGEQQGAIAFADPELSSQKTVAATREALWDGPLQLGRLAHARREARSLTRAAGRGSELLVGREASEARLKGARVSQYRVLHFAAHAVTDDAHPDRSAIVLAPGSDAEDGLLQIREIVELDLRGPMVILSGCRSASGSVLAGEGVMGLARAFLHAGARAVVGSLWPLRDDEAAALIEEFADNLGRGSSVDSALARARASLAGRGMPVSAWAGVVAIGDGGFTPFPGQPSRSPGPSTILIAAGVLLTVLLIVVAVRTLSTR
jgi:CHAT domain-containing protein